jgi:starvation-inducible DNA-binding protein
MKEQEMSSDFSQPWLYQHGRQVQEFGTVRHFPIALSYTRGCFPASC